MIDTCFLTKRKLDETFEYQHDMDFNGHKYYMKPVGWVYISSYAIEMIKSNNFDLSAIAGLCRCAYELKEEPPVIDTELIVSIKTLKNIPRTFKEKFDHFLSILYKTGGNEYRARTIEVEEDYPLAYAIDISELQRIIDLAISNGDLECSNTFDCEEAGTLIYLNLRFTPKGLAKVDKLINNYFSIIQPKIDSGDTSIDRKINHAVSLFYQDNATIEDKRSAAEELSFILEPFRKDMGKYFLDKDVNLFFQLVNEFDIRHNKVLTKKLIHEEQFEWLFHCLLNTLLTYIKLKKRFE